MIVLLQTTLGVICRDHLFVREAAHTSLGGLMSLLCVQLVGHIEFRNEAEPDHCTGGRDAVVFAC